MDTTADVVDRRVVLSPRGLLAPLRRHDFRWLIAGQMLSTFGGVIFTVALPFMVLRTGDARDLGLTLFALGLGRVLGAPVGGVLSDRWQPRQVMLFADMARAGVLFVLVQVATAGDPDLLYLAVAIGALGVLDGMFVPAYWAVSPTVLPKDELIAGNSAAEAAMLVAVMAGGVAGGIAAAVLSPAEVFAVNALSFVVSAGSLVRVRGIRTVDRTERGEGGVRFRAFVRGSRLFVVMLVMTAMLHLTAAGIVSVAIPVYAKTTFPDGERVFGLLISAQGAGLLAGTIVAGLLARLARRGYVAVALLAVHGSTVLAFPFLPGLAALLAAMVVLGLVVGTLGILVLTMLQQIAPAAVRGRVMGAFGSATIGSFPISVVIIGLIVTSAGPQSAFLFAGIGVLGVAAFGLAQPAVRRA